MSTLSARNQLHVGLVLAVLMAATRSQHFASLHHLPEASWAVFFLAGFYLRPVWAFPALCGMAAAIDTIAITWGGVSSFCVTPAYGMLLPAYAALWLGGRWYARRHEMAASTLIPLSAAVLVASVLAEAFSSGGFYFLSGRFAEPTIAEFAARVVKYFPPYLGAMALYVGVAALVHCAVVFARRGDARGSLLG